MSRRAIKPRFRFSALLNLGGRGQGSQGKAIEFVDAKSNLTYLRLLRPHFTARSEHRMYFSLVIWFNGMASSNFTHTAPLNKQKLPSKTKTSRICKSRHSLPITGKAIKFMKIMIELSNIGVAGDIEIKQVGQRSLHCKSERASTSPAIFGTPKKRSLERMGNGRPRQQGKLYLRMSSANLMIRNEIPNAMRRRDAAGSHNPLY